MDSYAKDRIRINSRCQTWSDVHAAGSMGIGWTLYVGNAIWFGALKDHAVQQDDCMTFQSEAEALAFRDANFDKWMEIREHQAILFSL